MWRRWFARGLAPRSFALGSAATSILGMVAALLVGLAWGPPPARAAGSAPEPPVVLPGAREEAARQTVFRALWPRGFDAALPEDVKRGEQSAPDLVPPERIEPRLRLAPLPASEQGIVRRVDPVDPAAPPLAALTFDLCERAPSITGFERAVPRILEHYGAQATFFLGGKWMRDHPERTLQVLLHPGFEAGDHAWTHGNFALLDAAGRVEQVRWTQAEYELMREVLVRRVRAAGLDADLTEAALSAVPAVPRLFRLPYGRSCPAALDFLAGEGLRVIQWDLAAESFGGGSVEARAEALARRVHPGSILLFHANRVPHDTPALLDALLARLAARGYRFVTVSRLLASGRAETVWDGWFEHPGDNQALDRRFLDQGTGHVVHSSTAHPKF